MGFCWVPVTLLIHRSSRPRMFAPPPPPPPLLALFSAPPFIFGSHCTRQMFPLAPGQGLLPSPQSATDPETLPIPLQRIWLWVPPMPAVVISFGPLLSTRNAALTMPALLASCLEAVERMSTPGAEMSTCACFCEKGASRLLQSTAATEMTSG